MNGLEIKEFRKKHSLTQKELASIVKVSESAVRSWEQGHRNITQSVIEILKRYDDEMKSKNLGQDINESRTSERSYPLVEGTAIGGVWNNKIAIEERDVKDYYVIPKFQNKKVDFMIEVEGSSMYPKYSSGDVVACRIIREQNFIQWNKTHVVATKNQGIIIKRIKKGNCEDNLLMVSDNKDYDPFYVPVDEIEGVALVVGVIRLE